MTAEPPPPPGAVLQLQDLHVSFGVEGGRIEAVRGVSFALRRGSVLALVGESGSGKSAIAQAILRILPKNGSIDRGRILFADPASSGAPLDIAALKEGSATLRQLRGGRISMIFQEPMSALSPLHTIGDQVEEALRLHRRQSAAEAKRMTHEVLGLVGFSDPVAAYGRYAFELSGGLRQRAVIAMALICNPALVIADEPTTALDVTVQAQVLGLMRELQQRLHTSILLITHDLGVVANMADDVVVMYHGKVMEAGPVRTLLSDARHPYVKALLAAVPRLERAPCDRLASLRDLDDGHARAIERLAARFAASAPARGASTDAAPPLLEVLGLRKAYALRRGRWFAPRPTPIVVVDDVGFSIRRGECLGLVGESGSGKTTVSKIILRALEASGGTVRLYPAGEPPIDVLALQGRALFDYRRRAQMIFQDPFSSLNPRMTVQRILAEPFEIHGLCERSLRRDEIVDLMSLVGLDARFLNRYPHSFSGGQRQRIGIARALTLRPELLICDEPVSALDVSVQAQILNLLNDLRTGLGLTTLFISHNLAVVNYVADRIAVMCRGRLVEIAPREALFARPVHPYTRSLLASIPVPDLDHPLDFKAIRQQQGGNPATWAPEFHAAEPKDLALVEIAPGHSVLANRQAELREVA